MKSKKIFILLILVLILIIFLIFVIVKNYYTKNLSENKITEYTPEEEISSTQTRETTITLYFIENSTGQIKSEGKIINSTDLIQNPYKTLIEELLTGPTSTSFSSPFPENTKINTSKIENHCVTLDFSENILNIENETQKNNIINTILNTLTELNEVISFKITINNEPSEIYNDIYSL